MDTNSTSLFNHYIEDHQLEKKLGFDIIKNNIKSLCISILGSKNIEDIKFSSDYTTVKSGLTLSLEMLKVFGDKTLHLPLSDIMDMHSAFVRTSIEGTFLEVGELFELKKNLDTLEQVVGFFVKTKDPERFKNLLERSRSVVLFPKILKEIDCIIDKTGEIKDNASSNLRKIRDSIYQTRISVSKTMNQVIGRAKKDGIVDTETAPSIRDGRLVIPVLAHNKKLIAGIMHDESATGKTVFIEPSQVVFLNNKLRELENEERREIAKILTSFTNLTRQHYCEIETSISFLGKIDSLAAIAKYSQSIRAIVPEVENDTIIDFVEARHPILQEILKAQNKSIVPLNINLKKNRSILIISGPNAGGKSVCIKTAALLQYMLQCGLPVPVGENSKSGIFKNIFVDIGDGENIENDLSTYSAHLKNLKFILKHSTAESLVIIDEFGSGTEPNTGGAIAQASLEEFYKKKLFALITTHYETLKYFANEHQGIINGAMLYDKSRMQPLFVLQTGISGSSFAIEIAKNIGLPKEVIDKSIELIGTDKFNFDKNYQLATRDRLYWQRKRDEIRQKEKKVEQIIEDYKTRLSAIDKQEKEIIQKAKAEASAIISQSNSEIERTIREIKESGADKTTTKLAKEKLQKYKQNIKVEVIPKIEKTKLQIGDMVGIKGQNVVGEIVDINNSVATVMFGSLRSRIKVSELEFVSKSTAKRSKSSVKIGRATINFAREKNLEFTQEIDIRGMRVDEATIAVSHYIDDASIAGAARVRILHGTGQGALLSAVRRLLSSFSHVKSFRDEHVQLGGSGITVVELA